MEEIIEKVHGFIYIFFISNQGEGGVMSILGWNLLPFPS